MGTLASDACAATVQAKTMPQGVLSKTATYVITTALNVTANIFQMVKIPIGATVIGVVLVAADIDTSTSITLDVGDGDSHNRYIEASTIAQAGGSVWSLGYAALKKYTANDTIDITIHAQAGTAAEGSLTLTVLYTMDA